MYTDKIIERYIERNGKEKWDSLTEEEKSQYINVVEAEIESTAKRVKSYTEARARAIKKYHSKTVAIQIRVTKAQRDKYRVAAAEKGLSLTQYIIYKLENE